ncbi:unnamed protein product [Hymenolepis diminuta]|uniref:RING-type domain-containing protein n=2 Tax=Hymenolepis diminuta TaxID=6216 RepID=A0A0R3SJ33_HYMDI|nr:unnamed protein product [Hymenolepis diminuta]
MDNVGASDTCDNFCPICRENITPPIATLDVCLHRYCYTCLKDWFDIHQSCPLDRKSCRRITVLPPENTKKRIRCWNPGDRLQIRAFWNNLGEPDVSPINEARENDTQSENSDLAVSIATTEEDLIVFTIRLAGFVEKRIRTNLNGLSEDVVNSIVEELSEDLHVIPFLGLVFAGVSIFKPEFCQLVIEIRLQILDDQLTRTLLIIAIS